MAIKYYVRAAIRAIYDKPDGKHVSVDLPTGAILTRPSQPSEKGTTLFGMVGVYWEGKHYSVYPNDLALKTEQVQCA